MDAKYLDCEVHLSTGVDANAVSIFMKVKKVLYRHLVDGGEDPQKAKEVSDEFVEEDRSGDYNHVLTTCSPRATVG